MEQVLGRTKSHPPELLREGVKDARWFAAPAVDSLEASRSPNGLKTERRYSNAVISASQRRSQHAPTVASAALRVKSYLHSTAAKGTVGP